MTLHEVWDHIMPAERRPLGLLILASAVLHAGVFGLLQVERLDSRVFSTRPRQVTLLDTRLQSGGLGAGSWATWLDWKDPSAIALPWEPLPEPALPGDLQTRGPRPGAMPVPGPLPDAMPRDLPRSLEQEVDQRLRAGQREAMPLPVEAPPALAGTAYRVEGGLAGRRILRAPALPQPRTDLSLKATVLSVAVNRLGLVESATVEESSLEPAVDELAVNAVQGWRFAPVPAAPERQTGRVTVFWDLDAKPGVENAPASP